MTFADLKVDDKFRAYQHDGRFDPKSTVYTKITPFLYAGKHQCNVAWLGKKNGQPRMYYEFVKDSEQVKLASSTS